MRAICLFDVLPTRRRVRRKRAASSQALLSAGKAGRGLQAEAVFMYFFDALDGHGVVVLKEHDAHLPQPPTGNFFVLWGHIDCHRGDGAEEEPVLPHLQPVGP